jgi:hypothetical protein
MKSIKYGPSFLEGLDRAYRSGQQIVEEIGKQKQALKCPGTGDKHELDDGKCLHCGLDLEFTRNSNAYSA